LPRSERARQALRAGIAAATAERDAWDADMDQRERERRVGERERTAHGSLGGMAGAAARPSEDELRLEREHAERRERQRIQTETKIILATRGERIRTRKEAVRMIFDKTDIHSTVKFDDDIQRFEELLDVKRFTRTSLMTEDRLAELLDGVDVSELPPALIDVFDSNGDIENKNPLPLRGVRGEQQFDFVNKELAMHLRCYSKPGTKPDERTYYVYSIVHPADSLVGRAVAARQASIPGPAAPYRGGYVPQPDPV
jgi:hypothetical protein